MKRPFEGIRVLDFGTNVAGPNAAAMLSDFGADVIKIERPGTGDEARAFRPWVEGRSVMNMWLNRGKRSLSIPLGEEQSNAALKELIKTADVMIESFRPGVMKKFGLDYGSVSKINPRLVYCSISMFGHEGNLSKTPGYDLLAQAMTGMMDASGYPDGPPQRNGFSVCDYVASHNAFGGIAMALYNREKTGEGQHVDIGLFNVGFSMNPYIETTMLGYNSTRSGDHHKSIGPYGVFSCSKGSLAIISPTPKLWASLCTLIGHEEMIDDPDFAEAGPRLQNIERVVAVVEEWMEGFDDLSEPERLLMESGIPCSKVLNNAEAIEKAVEDDYNTVVDMETPSGMEMKTIRARGPHIKLSATPGKVTKGSPNLGEHSAEILKELGYGDEEIKKMTGAGGQ
ncbi:CoA transferase [Christensenellaceae bacterium OttesenSCG-928-K19]|nr:CoA transferase [Christensenellaceae bacterium OttesenSCG-928-K19]